MCTSLRNQIPQCDLTWTSGVKVNTGRGAKPPHLRVRIINGWGQCVPVGVGKNIRRGKYY